MKYILTVRNDDYTEDWLYDVESNRLYRPDGTEVPALPGEKPGPCGHDASRLQLRITMGMGCNNHCIYCSQNNIKDTSLRPASSYRDYARAATTFIRRHFPGKRGVSCSFWGGEPLLYMDGIKALHAEFRELWGENIDFGLCTNGKLFRGENFKWLADNGFGIAVSHDGPGQFIRDGGRDIFAPGSEILENFKSGMSRTVNPYVVNPVFHRHNPSIRAYCRHMRDVLDTDAFIIGEGSFIKVYDDKSAALALTEEQARNNAFEQISMMLEGEAKNFARLLLQGADAWRMRLGSNTENLFCLAHHQREYLGIDLEGNVWACHNNIGDLRDENGEDLRRGNIFSGEHRFLKFSRHAGKFDSFCRDCALRWICRGGCLLSPSKYDALNCRTYWLFYLPVLVIGMNLVSGGHQLVSIRKNDDAAEVMEN